MEDADALRASRARLARAGQLERRRVERDLHDGAQQHFTLLALKLRAVEELVARQDPAALEVFAELHDALRRGIDSLRELARGIYPPLLVTDGLPAALADAIDRAAVPATLECRLGRRLPPEIEGAVYFCCAEALTNAAKHAGEGARIAVQVEERDGELVLLVEDDGAGHEVDVARSGSGLLNMTDRIEALGGSVAVESAPGRGTRIRARVPVS